MMKMMIFDNDDDIAHNQRLMMIINHLAIVHRSLKVHGYDCDDQQHI